MAIPPAFQALRPNSFVHPIVTALTRSATATTLSKTTPLRLDRRLCGGKSLRDYAIPSSFLGLISYFGIDFTTTFVLFLVFPASSAPATIDCAISIPNREPERRGLERPTDIKRHDIPTSLIWTAHRKDARCFPYPPRSTHISKQLVDHGRAGCIASWDNLTRGAVLRADVGEVPLGCSARSSPSPPSRPCLRHRPLTLLMCPTTLPPSTYHN